MAVVVVVVVVVVVGEHCGRRVVVALRRDREARREWFMFIR